MSFLRWLKPARRTWRFDEDEAAYTVFDQRLAVPRRLKKGDTFVFPVRAIEIKVEIA